MPTTADEDDLHGSTDQPLAAGWKRCLDGAGDRLLYEMINEREFFTISEYDRTYKQSLLVQAL